LVHFSLIFLTRLVDANIWRIEQQPGCRWGAPFKMPAAAWYKSAPMNPLSKILRAASLAVLVVALWFLSSVHRPASYYPLTPDLSWVYEVREPANPGIQVRLEVSNNGLREIGGWKAVEQRIFAGGRPGFRYIVENKEFIATVGEQSPGKTQPTLVNPPALLLRFPLEVGQTWQSDATTTAVHPGTKIDVTAKVESVSDKVEVPAGVFDSCLRVESSGTVGIEGEEPGDMAVVRIETTFWYALGVGVVKIERKEMTDKPERVTAEVHYSLVTRNS